MNGDPTDGVAGRDHRELPRNAERAYFPSLISTSSPPSNFIPLDGRASHASEVSKSVEINVRSWVAGGARQGVGGGVGALLLSLS